MLTGSLIIDLHAVNAYACFEELNAPVFRSSLVLGTSPAMQEL